MIDVAQAFEMDDEILLLGGPDGASAEGGVDVKSGCLSVFRCVDDDGCNFLEGAPITIKNGSVDFGVK